MWCILFGALVILVLVVAFLKTRGYQQDYVRELDKKKHPLKAIYPLALYLLLETPIGGWMEQQQEEREILGRLELWEDEQTLQIMFWCKRLAIAIALVAGGAFLTICMVGAEKGTSVLQQGKYLQRQQAGQGSTETSVVISSEGKEEEKITVTVPEQSYTEVQLQEKMEQAKAYVTANYLGENESEEAVSKSLNFMTVVPDSAITVSWYSWDEELIKSDGSIGSYYLEQPSVCALTATLAYGETTEKLEFEVLVLPQKEISQEVWKEAVEEAMVEAGTTDPTKEQMALPDQVLGQPVHYKEPEKKQYPVALLGAICLAVVLWICFGSDLKKKLALHDTQMLLDYPELVNKFTLLLGAGMTVSGAWERIATEYEQGKKQGKPMRYAYEEWCRTQREMENGVSEMQALEYFGQRIRLMPYLKFSTLLSQNLRKGSKGLLALLEYEAVDAFESRKQLTRKLSEEAGTKLLAPMMLMLILVMIIIIVPAFMSM